MVERFEVNLSESFIQELKNNLTEIFALSANYFDRKSNWDNIIGTSGWIYCLKKALNRRNLWTIIDYYDTLSYNEQLEFDKGIIDIAVKFQFCG